MVLYIRVKQIQIHEWCLRGILTYNSCCHSRYSAFSKRSKTHVRFSSISYNGEFSQKYTNFIIYRLRKTYEKLNKFNSAMSYFGSQQWHFCNDSVIKLWGRINPADREIFDFNLDNLDWESYLKYLFLGMRIYLLNDPIETIEKGRVKYKKWVYSAFVFISQNVYTNVYIMRKFPFF